MHMPHFSVTINQWVNGCVDLAAWVQTQTKHRPYQSKNAFQKVSCFQVNALR